MNSVNSQAINANERECRMLYTLLAKEKLEERIIGEEYQDLLRNGDVLLGYKLPEFLNKYFLSRTISKITHSAATHSGIYIDGKIFHARMFLNKLLVQPISDRKNEIILAFRPMVEEEKIRSLEENIRMYISAGKTAKFDHLGIIGFYASKIFNTTRNIMDIEDRYYCSEAVATYFNNVGISLTNKNPSLVSPKDILESDKLNFMYIIDGLKNGKRSAETKDSAAEISDGLNSLYKKFCITE